MKLLLLLGLLCVTLPLLTKAANPHGADIDDNDFAEFEDFDDDEDIIQEDPSEPKPPPVQPKVIMSPDAIQDDVEEEEDATVEAIRGIWQIPHRQEDEDDFEYLIDEEEFEGFDKDTTLKGKKSHEPQPDLKITKVPLHLRSNWDSFYMEMLMLAGLAVYFLNFLAGKSKNSRLAQAWYNAHKQLLEDNFSVVGDDGLSKEIESGILMKESENIYSLWCSGRIVCEGMLVTLKLLKRQDLVSTISRIFKPISDQIIVKVTMDPAEMDNFVMCLANKKVATKLQKEMNDLANFCPEKKKAESYNLPSSFTVLSEIHEATASIFDRTILAAINKYEGCLEYMHISDQYSGPKPQDDQPTKLPDVEKVLIFCFNVPSKGKSTPADMEGMKPLMQMVFYCMEKVRRLKLPRESKVKSDRNRQKYEESFLKMSHSQRQEMAQQRREDKRRAEKERMMNEEDPDKQRKWEERENRREMKKKQAKMKMMKVKAM